MIVTEFVLGDNGEATIKLLPVNMLDTPAEVENVDFKSSDEDVALTVDINDHMVFRATSGTIDEEKDVTLHLEADGKLGEGTSQISKDLLCHLRRREAADVKFDVNIVK
mgnify:FL=1